VKISAAHPWFHPSMLLFWVALGLTLRLLHLTDKTLWTDEFATIVFSLGHTFYSVPLDQVITAEQLLQPLYSDSTSGIRAVVGNLMNESNHPPLYFVLTHFWLKLFPTADGLVSVWGARSLSAFFGTAAIPATYLLGWVAFRSRLVAQISAALMAVSPFGLYLSQEARHYTLPVLWVIASLCCLIVATRSVRDRTPLPLWICLTWIVVNALGLATHFFFAFTLAAEALVIAMAGLVQSWRERGTWYSSSHWWRIWVVAGSAAASGLVWVPFLQDVQDSELTRWIFRDLGSGWNWIMPIAQAIAGWITMLYLLPIQTSNPWINGISGFLLIILTLWTIPKLYWGLKAENLGREKQMAAWALEGFIGLTLVLFFGVTYSLSADMTSAFRYNFVYFPAVIVLVGAGLATGWDAANKIAKAPATQIPYGLLGVLRTGGKKGIIVIGLLGCLGAMTVASNGAYQKIHRPDVVAQAIQQQSMGLERLDQSAPPAETVLIAIVHHSHGQTGRMMGIAWDLKSLASSSNVHDSDPHNHAQPLFLLAHHSQQPRSVTIALRKALNQLQAPLTLWLINFQDVPTQSLDNVLQQNKCTAKNKAQSVDGYRYRLYRCAKKLDS
jgi:uncharacterized membrane protein